MSIGCGWRAKSMTDDERGRCLRVLDIAFGGLHHLPEEPTVHNRYVECVVVSGLSTFDFNSLTALVIMAHEECVRLEIFGSGLYRLKLLLHPRKGREGIMFERHPTIEEAVFAVREYKKERICD
jgi:hypothetical protein